MIFFAATLIIASMLNLFFIGQILEKDYKAALHSELLVLGDSLQTQLKRITSLGISTRDIEGFNQQCSELVKNNKRLTQAMIIDGQGTIIFHNDPSLQGKRLIHKDILASISKGEKGIYTVEENKESVYFAVFPFGDVPNYFEYAVVITSPAKVINDKILSLINRCNIILLLTFGPALILLLGSLTTMLTSPLAVILNTMKHITQSRDLQERVNIKSHDEIGEIAGAFNQMTADLQHSTTSIDNLNREVTERKKTEEKLTQLLSLYTATLESTADGILVVDLSGKVASYNKKFLQLWQIPDILAQSKDDNKLLAFVLDQLINPEKFLSGVKRLYSHPEEQSVDTLEFKDGRVFERYSQPHRIGSEIAGRVWCFRDITKQKEDEKIMKRLNQELESTVEDLESANREMKNFVYIASHDLREPLRKVTAFGAMLRNSLLNKLSRDDAENLQFIIDGAQRMTQMIEGLLVYSRVSTQAQPPQDVNLNEIVTQLQQLELAMLIEEKHVTIEAKSLPCVQADPAQVRQLMQNLIANGIKYQKKDNTPHITITSKPAADNMVRIEITDNGIGIKPEFQGAIFTMFKRLHSRNEYEGTGIGLAVCKKIVERHDGKIGVESQPDKGSTFWFTMPVADKPAAVAAQSKNAESWQDKLNLQ